MLSIDARPLARVFFLAAALAALPAASLAQSPRLRPPSTSGLAAPAPAAPSAAQPDAKPADGRGTRTLDRIVAVVNEEVVTAKELQLRMSVAEQQLKRQNIALPAREVLQRQVLERIIIDRAQVQLARESGVRVDDATVNATVARIAEQNRLDLPQFRARLESEGVSFARFREDVRDDIIMTRLRDREVDSRIQITEAEVENFLAEQAGVAAGAIEYNIAQILLRVPDNAGTDRIEVIRKQAEDLAAQARTGADFARLAASYSAAPEALKGGELGWRSADRLPTLFVDAVKNLKPGQVAPLVRSPGGFHILKLAGSRNAVESRIATGPLQQTRARHILLRVSDLTPEPELRRRLTDLRERATKGGQDFGSLARLHSVDQSSTRGGELGWLYPGDTVPEFERAMDALKPGEISEPVQSPFGWHLIQVLERRTDESPVERNRLAARMALRERKSDEAYQEWLRQLRDRTYVELRLDEA
jgi:peptidyl-prolyl cis-trans isomerase SurA